MKKVRKAVLPVAGWGTRFLPATKVMPKEMLAVVDRPVIQYAVEEALAAGIEEFIFVTGRGKQTIENHFDHNFELEHLLREKNRLEELDSITRIIPKEGKIFYTRQSQRKGLGHAVLCTRELIGDEPFAVLLPDDIIWTKEKKNTLKGMLDLYEEKETSVVLTSLVKDEQVSRYGIIDPGDSTVEQNSIKVKNFVEKPALEDAPSNYAIMGRYIFSPKIFDHLEKTKPGAGQEVQLTDAMAELVKSDGFNAYLLDGVHLDCGDKAGYIKATIFMALQQPNLRSDIIEYIKSLNLENAN